MTASTQYPATSRPRKVPGKRKHFIFGMAAGAFGAGVVWAFTTWKNDPAAQFFAGQAFAAAVGVLRSAGRCNQHPIELADTWLTWLGGLAGAALAAFMLTHT